MEIQYKRNALIWNSISITLNISVVLIYFLFIPITLMSDGTMTFGYFLNLKTLAFLFSCGAILAHFFIVKFALLERDYIYILLTFCVWTIANLCFENRNGLFFREVKGSKNIIKISLASFIAAATTCMYLVLCNLSQMLKKVHEKHTLKNLIKSHRRAHHGTAESDSDDSDDN